ncbi:MAG: hypothetical protein PHV93_02160 [Candidatus Pacebacteria bacterium]|nr:hypothetical protein [Candidatus Paceibacterota bacterium]
MLSENDPEEDRIAILLAQLALSYENKPILLKCNPQGERRKRIEELLEKIKLNLGILGFGMGKEGSSLLPVPAGFCFVQAHLTKTFGLTPPPERCFVAELKE